MIEQITVNPINEKLFSAEFLKGFRCGAKRQYQADVEEIAKAKFGRPTGEWVRLEREENVYDLHGVPTWGVNYMCDKCGFITTAIQDHFEQYKFCPHCGKRLVIER